MRCFFLLLIVAFTCSSAYSKNRSYSAKVVYVDGKEETFESELAEDENGNVFLWKDDCTRIYPGDTKYVELIYSNGTVTKGLPHDKQWLFVLTEGRASLYSVNPDFKKAKDLRYKIGEGSLQDFNSADVKQKFKNAPESYKHIKSYRCLRTVGYTVLGIGVAGAIVSYPLGFLYPGIVGGVLLSSTPLLLRRPAINHVVKAFDRY